MARIVPSWIGSSYVLPVRLSVTVRELLGIPWRLSGFALGVEQALPLGHHLRVARLATGEELFKADGERLPRARETLPKCRKRYSEDLGGFRPREAVHVGDEQRE